MLHIYVIHTYVIYMLHIYIYVNLQLSEALVNLVNLVNFKKKT